MHSIQPFLHLITGLPRWRTAISCGERWHCETFQPSVSSFHTPTSFFISAVFLLLPMVYIVFSYFLLFFSLSFSFCFSLIRFHWSRKMSPRIALEAKWGGRISGLWWSSFSFSDVFWMYFATGLQYLILIYTLYWYLFRYSRTDCKHVLLSCQDHPPYKLTELYFFAVHFTLFCKGFREKEIVHIWKSPTGKTKCKDIEIKFAITFPRMNKFPVSVCPKSTLYLCI